MRFTQIASLPSLGKVRLEAMSNVFEPTSAKLRELHSAVKIAYKKCQEGARRRIFGLYLHRHIIEVHAALSTIVCRSLMQIHTTTNKGLHEFVAERVLARYAGPGIRAADLGSGPGAMAARLHSFGCDVLAVDRSPEGFEADLPHIALDFNQNDFASEFGPASFDLVTAIEVIEHVESPIGFLRNIGRLLAPRGVAVITTPNVDSLPARAKFLLTGKIRTMDEFSEPTHISPIFWDLLRRQFLTRAGVRLREHFLFPPNGYQLSRKAIAWTFRIAAAAFPGDSILGDNHILVLETGR